MPTSKKEQIKEINGLMTQGYHHVVTALLVGNPPNFTCIDKARELIKELDKLTDFASCVQCKTLLEIDKDRYIGISPETLTICSGKTEVNALLPQNSKIYMCDACAIPILDFFDKEIKKENADEETNKEQLIDYDPFQDEEGYKETDKEYPIDYDPFQE